MIIPCRPKWKCVQTDRERFKRQMHYPAFDRCVNIGGWGWMNPSFPRNVVAETVTTRTLMNGDGLLAEVPIDGHDTIPHFIKASVPPPEDYRHSLDLKKRMF